MGIDPEVAGLIERAEAATPGKASPARPWSKLDGGRAGPHWGVAVGVLAVGVAAFVLIVALTIWPRDSESSRQPAAFSRRPSTVSRQLSAVSLLIAES